MSDKPVPPSVAEFTLQERQQLLATIARYETTTENYELLQAKMDEQAREIERLKQHCAKWQERAANWSALKAQHGKAVGDE